MKQKLWINMAKFAAILAVLVDHTRGVLYTKRSVAVASFFSVSLFIFLMGVTTYMSFAKSVGALGKKVAGKIGAIAVAYALATFVYCLVAFHQFDFAAFLTYLTHFTISGPFYYILLYVQLCLISVPVFYFIFFAFHREPTMAKITKIAHLYGGGY